MTLASNNQYIDIQHYFKQMVKEEEPNNTQKDRTLWTLDAYVYGKK